MNMKWIKSHKVFTRQLIGLVEKKGGGEFVDTYSPDLWQGYINLDS